MTDDWWNIKILWPECRCLCTGYDFSDIQERFQCALHGNSVLDFGCGSGRDTKKFEDLNLQKKFHTVEKWLHDDCYIYRNGIYMRRMQFVEKNIFTRKSNFLWQNRIGKWIGSPEMMSNIWKINLLRYNKKEYVFRWQNIKKVWI